MSNAGHRQAENHRNIFQLFRKNDKRNPLHGDAGGSESSQVTGWDFSTVCLHTSTDEMLPAGASHSG